MKTIPAPSSGAADSCMRLAYYKRVIMPTGVVFLPRVMRVAP